MSCAITSSLTLALAVLVVLPVAGRAAGGPRTLVSPLIFEAAHQDDPSIRTRIARWLGDPTKVSTDSDGEGRWIVTDGAIVLTAGTAYRQELGDHPWARLVAGGHWAAGGSLGVLVDGSFHADPRLSGALRQQLDSANVSVPRAGEPAMANAAAANLESRPRELVMLRGPAAPGSSPERASTLAPAAPANFGPASNVTVVHDTTPPTVQNVQMILHPTDPARRVVVAPGAGVFVGFEAIGVRVTMSEHMGSAPRVSITQPGAAARDASLTDGSHNPVFDYLYVPDFSPAHNGPTSIAILGDATANPPYGTDDAGNPIQPGSPGSGAMNALFVDTVPPDIRRVDIHQPGNFRMLPPENSVLPKSGFPKDIVVLVSDYNQPDDGTFSGNNVATDRASGVDFDRATFPGGPIQVHLFDPTGREIKGVLVTGAPTAVRLLLPNVYDPRTGIFPDVDHDGVADPFEGTYRVQVDLVDRAGNQTSRSLSLGLDATPIHAASLSVSIQPVFTTPFPNPHNPIGDHGTAIKKLEQILITSSEPDFDPSRTTARLLSYVPGQVPFPREMRTTITRQGRTVILTVDRDQTGSGSPNFENPPPAPNLPPGTVDPRMGRNDGSYVVEVTAFDTAGNSSTITKEILLDTTPPQVGTTFPAAGVTLGGPLRIVDAIVSDPKAASGVAGSGVRLDFSTIALRFLGNAHTPPQIVHTLAFVHSPNDSDPTQPGFNPNDHFPKLALEIVNAHNDSTPLPQDGSFDGPYHIEVTVRDQASNEASGITSFTYNHRSPTTTATLDITTLVPIPR